MSDTSEQTYFYGINYSVRERELCLLEMRSLFGQDISKKYIFSTRNIDPSRSPFVKFRISLLYTAATLQELVQILIDAKMTCNNFKFARFKFEEGELDYATWLQSATELGTVIHGEVDMRNPSIQLGFTVLDGRWMFGIYEKNETPWVKHNQKPYTNSNSLDTRTARAIVNIATGEDMNTMIVDPCCGIGTVVLEALSLGIPIHGYEISWIVTNQAKQNVSYFGYDDCIKQADMNKITQKYEVAILDLPYGLFSGITEKQQMDIIKSSRHITKKLVMITCVDMDEDIISAGFTIIDRCKVAKGLFARYIRVCR